MISKDIKGSQKAKKKLATTTLNVDSEVKANVVVSGAVTTVFAANKTTAAQVPGLEKCGSRDNLWGDSKKSSFHDFNFILGRQFYLVFDTIFSYKC
jgi:hypothetical protein